MLAEIILYTLIFVFWIWENSIFETSVFFNTSDNLGEHCPICLEDFTFENPDYGLTECKKKGRIHCFHKDCIHKILKESNSCPLCRETIIKPKKNYNICRYSRLIRKEIF
jgi:hypothetical protein